MALLTFGILLVVLGLILAFTNAFGIGAIGGTLMWLGWICVGIGVILAVVHFVTAGRRRDVVVEHEYRRPPTY